MDSRRKLGLLRRDWLAPLQERLAFWHYRGAVRRSRRGRQGARIQAVEPSIYDRRAQVVTWFSPALGVAKRFQIYLPPPYAGSTERYPVLYLLRGHEREWLNGAEDRSRQGHNVLDVYERLCFEGRIGPLILVMPGLTSDDGIAHGAGVDNPAPWLAKRLESFGTGRWEHSLVHDLIPLVDAHWRTLANGRHRGVDGFSLGGAVAVRLAAKYPALFRSVGAYDGSFFYAIDHSTAPVDDRLLHNPIWDPSFGRPRDMQHAARNSPANLILNADRAALAQITWMIQYGPEAIEPWGSNFYRGEHLLAALAGQGIRNALDVAVLGDGDHSWRTADRRIAQTLPIHWWNLRDVSGDGAAARTSPAM